MIKINTSHILPDTPYLLDGTESADILELPPDMLVFGVDFQRNYSPGLAPFPRCMVDAFKLGYLTERQIFIEMDGMYYDILGNRR